MSNAKFFARQEVLQFLIDACETSPIADDPGSFAEESGGLYNEEHLKQALSDIQNILVSIYELTEQ